MDEHPGYTAKRLYERVKPTSYSEAEAFFLDVKRRYALSQGERELRSVIDGRVKVFTSRRYRPDGEFMDD